MSMVRFLAALSLAAALAAASPAALALTAAEAFAKTRHAIYLIFVTDGEPGVVSVVAQGSAVLKVYGALIRQHVAEQLRWNEGGSYVCEFNIQLRRSGEVMFVIPATSSGVERFDQVAQRAIGAASPLPVPQDNEAFAQMSEMFQFRSRESLRHAARNDAAQRRHNYRIR